MTKTISPLSVRLEPRLAAALERYCVRSGQSRSRVVQHCLTEYLAARTGPTLGEIAEAVLPSLSGLESPPDVGGVPSASASTVIAEAGFLTTLFDESNPLHRRSRAFLRAYQGRFLTTQAAVARTLSLLTRTRQLRCIHWFSQATDAGLLAVDADPIDFRLVESLARGVEETPLDLSRVSVVLLSVRSGVREILVGDPGDFDAREWGDRAHLIAMSRSPV